MYRQLQRNLTETYDNYSNVPCNGGGSAQDRRDLKNAYRDARSLRAPERPDARFRGSDKGLADETYVLVPVVAPALRPIMEVIRMISNGSRTRPGAGTPQSNAPPQIPIKKAA